MNKIATLAGLLAGTFLLLYWGGSAPHWLLKLEVLAVSLSALAFGFTAFNPRAPDWLRHDSVRGVALVYLGCGCMFIPLNFLASAALIGAGCRLVTKSTVQLTARIAGVPLTRGTTEIVAYHSDRQDLEVS